MPEATASGKTVADKDGKWGASWDAAWIPSRKLTYIPPKGERNIIFPTTLGGDMLVPRMVMVDTC